ncbi:MAG: hypothetical protein KZQ66_14310 [Candidatus Thiodiazotropha sp. (ex Lucinoma aequizonata)]|nr:hypothetical protein [Candidatus Thiodiazotropha sp. (ex Lucinoma aequizonata)]MCU7886867.1 hypothetical protein [Candidatus Thiodiazotropha sp. (ex Lucinoma aequizonata)]MCU7895931.1 hypothetical protein [Candidatus Thiodiazotropha sp. (ex Lucinoma aequizonata)]MCU7899574.1 hypothetical protein [Candidatus Thiodiazotropha sp. (ex Lucinoma aequizonata)]MCU7903021.1 hypothetical protein [Candidatus Thiodiazotropha sp. (ex Lucinoma aequizonata)]
MATTFSLAAAAILCAMRGYKDISIWVESLGDKARSRFRCRKRKGKRNYSAHSAIADQIRPHASS